MNHRRFFALLFIITCLGTGICQAQMKTTAAKLEAAKRTARVHQPPAPARADSTPPAQVPPPSPPTDRWQDAESAADESATVAAGERDVAQENAAEATRKVPVQPEAVAPWLKVIAAPIAAVLILLGCLAVVLKMRSLESKVDRSLENDSRRERDRHGIEKASRDELGRLKDELHAEIDSVRTMIRSLPADTARLVAQAAAQQGPPREPARPAPRAPVLSGPSTDGEPYGAVDGVAQLLTIANRIVRQSSTTLDAFRASMGSLAANVSGWPSASESTPAAFIVEYRGSCYAIPNVVKPARLPQEWFNRSEFGVNDEIHSVESLPRLRRRGNGYDVQDAGVFVR
jgi:hypothetical protein